MAADDPDGASGAAAAPARNSRSATKYRAQATCPDGRACRLCDTPDDRPDHVHPDRLWAWGYPPGASGKNQGKVCYYCFRVYQARYEPKGCSITKLVADIGTNEEIHKTFFGYVEDPGIPGLLKFVSLAKYVAGLSGLSHMWRNAISEDFADLAKSGIHMTCPTNIWRTS